MIRDVVVHLLNEQPVVADMFEMPTARDAGFVCTNLRTIDGRRPIFIDRSDSVFFFPYQHIRFVEILNKADAVADGEEPPAATTSPARGPDDDDVEIDEGFLRRIREA